MKRCELCKSVAKTFCESDQASLCWSCDAKVHGANFLVARHSRTLLCHFCQSLTPWQAAGARLGHTVSFCLRCANGDTHETAQQQGAEAAEEGSGSGSEESDLDEEEDEEEEEEEDGDNQVVPWSASATSPPPASSSSSSSSSENDDDDGDYVQSRNLTPVKRTREEISADLEYLLEDDIHRRSDRQTPLTIRCCSVEESVRPLKNRRICATAGIRRTGARSAAIVELDRISHKLSEGEAAAVDDGDGDEDVSSDNISRTI